MQLEILAEGRGIRYTLHLEREVHVETKVDGKKQIDVTSEIYKKVIEFPTAFSLRDVVTRRIMDDVDAFSHLLRSEVGRLTPLTSEADFLKTHMSYFKAAMARSNVRDTLREIIARAAHVVGEAWPEGHPNFGQPVRVTIEEIAEGMEGDDLFSVALILMGMVQKERDRRKNVPAAAAPG